MSNSIHFNTAQNININLELASLWDRIAAYFIDYLIKIGYVILVVLTAYYGNSDLADPSSLLGWLFMIFLIPVVFYTFLFELFYNGQTPGKKIMSIKVVSTNGNNVSLAQYVTRWLFIVVDFYLLSGLVAVLSIALGEKGQRIGDMVAGTSVVRVKNRSLSKYDRFSPTEDGYEPKYTIAKNMNDKEIRLIKEVLSNRSENRNEIVISLAEKIQNTFHITKNEPSEDFLKTLTKDYQYYKTIYLEDTDKDFL